MLGKIKSEITKQTTTWEHISKEKLTTNIYKEFNQIAKKDITISIHK